MQERYYDRQFFTRKNANQDILGRFEKLLQNYFNSDDKLDVRYSYSKTVGRKKWKLVIPPLRSRRGHYLSELLKKETGQIYTDADN